MKHHRILFGILLLNLGGLFQVYASGRDPLEVLEAAFEENMKAIELSADQQKESILNHVAVRLDRIVLHYQNEGNNEFYFEAKKMVNSVRNGGYKNINPDKLSSQDLKRFHSNVEKALNEVDLNTADFLHLARKAYIAELEILIEKLQAEGKMGLVAMAEREINSIKQHEDYIHREAQLQASNN